MSERLTNAEQTDLRGRTWLGAYSGLVRNVEAMIDVRVAAERDALFAKFEALADEWEREEAYGCQDASVCIRCTTFQRVIIRIRNLISEARA